jgi:hypothetical protein
MESTHFIINYQIYPFDLLVSICEDDIVVRRILEKKLPKSLHSEIDDIFRDSLATTTNFSNKATFIRFNVAPTPDLIAHEALHAVEFLMERIGNKEVNEPWNYLLQYIISQIYKKAKL